MISQKDEKILSLLRQNSKISTREISTLLKVPITTIHNRIKKMERDGVIIGYSAIVNYKKLDKNIQALIQVTVSYTTATNKPISQQKLAEQLYQLAEVEQCYIITGKTDIFLFVIAKDVDELNNFIINKLRKIDGVENTETSIVLSDVSEKLRSRKFAAF